MPTVCNTPSIYWDEKALRTSQDVSSLTKSEMPFSACWEEK